MGEVQRSVTVGGEVSLSFPAPSGAGRTLLVIAPPGNISASLIAAVKCEFEWLTVKHAFRVASACTGQEPGTELILIDQRLLDDFLLHSHHIKRNYPLTSTAVMAGSRTPVSNTLIQVMETHSICGILPMDVNLDVWLSILRILLKGGEYFPPRLQQPTGTAEVGAPTEVLPRRSVHQSRTGSGAMDRLTQRERQILEKVARGNQNKIIASDLGLSEHTVKIHLHNIIHKLGVHNRTEAAALYHVHKEQQKTEQSSSASMRAIDDDAEEV